MKTATACPAGRLRTARHYRMGGLRASPAGSIRPISGPDSACGGAAGVRHLQNLRLFQRYHLPRGNGQPFGVPLAFPLATVIPGLVPGIHGGGDPCRCPRAEGVSAGRWQIPGTSPGMTPETISGPDSACGGATGVRALAESSPFPALSLAQREWVTVPESLLRSPSRPSSPGLSRGSTAVAIHAVAREPRAYRPGGARSPGQARG